MGPGVQDHARASGQAACRGPEKVCVVHRARPDAGPDRHVRAPVRHAQLWAHGGFCSVNMAAGLIYTIGGSFWEFGGPDLDRAKLFVMIGTAEDHHRTR